MGYVENNLMKNEKIVYQAQMHWWIFVRPVIFLIIGLAFLTAGEEGPTKTVGSVITILSLIGLLWQFIRKKTSEFVVSNKRVVLKVGVIRQNMNEVVLNKAEGMNVNQGLFGRIFGFGSIIVTSGGAANGYPTIADPLRFRKEINEQIEENATVKTEVVA